MHRTVRVNADVRTQSVCDTLRGRTYIYTILFTSTYTLAMLLVNLHTLTRKLSLSPFTGSAPQGQPRTTPWTRHWDSTSRCTQDDPLAGSERDTISGCVHEQRVRRSSRWTQGVTHGSSTQKLTGAA